VLLVSPVKHTAWQCWTLDAIVVVLLQGPCLRQLLPVNTIIQWSTQKALLTFLASACYIY
jgi:hypothetical protein